MSGRNICFREIMKMNKYLTIILIIPAYLGFWYILTLKEDNAFCKSGYFALFSPSSSNLLTLREQEKA